MDCTPSPHLSPERVHGYFRKRGEVTAVSRPPGPVHEHEPHERAPPEHGLFVPFMDRLFRRWSALGFSPQAALGARPDARAEKYHS